MKRGDLTITSIEGGIKVSGTDPDVNMDDLADAMWEGFLRSEERLRAEGWSLFRTTEDEMTQQVQGLPIEASNEAAGATLRGPLTFGEKAVGLSFNPSGDETVAKLKTLYAEIIDLCNNKRHAAQGLNSPTESKESARLWSIAITEAQEAQMWSVKAATWRGE